MPFLDFPPHYTVSLRSILTLLILLLRIFHMHLSYVNIFHQHLCHGYTIFYYTNEFQWIYPSLFGGPIWVASNI